MIKNIKIKYSRYPAQLCCLTYFNGKETDPYVGSWKSKYLINPLEKTFLLRHQVFVPLPPF